MNSMNNFFVMFAPGEIAAGSVNECMMGAVYGRTFWPCELYGGLSEAEATTVCRQKYPSVYAMSPLFGKIAPMNLPMTLPFLVRDPDAIKFLSLKLMSGTVPVPQLSPAAIAPTSASAGNVAEDGFAINDGADINEGLVWSIIGNEGFATAGDIGMLIYYMEFFSYCFAMAHLTLDEAKNKAVQGYVDRFYRRYGACDETIVLPNWNAMELNQYFVDSHYAARESRWGFPAVMTRLAMRGVL